MRIKYIRDKSGKIVGEVWRFPRSHKFGLKMYGIYWDTSGNPNRTQGCTTKAFPSQREAVAASAMAV